MVKLADFRRWYSAGRECTRWICPDCNRPRTMDATCCAFSVVTARPRTTEDGRRIVRVQR